jgi:hypothetical protein
MAGAGRPSLDYNQGPTTWHFPAQRRRIREIRGTNFPRARVIDLAEAMVIRLRPRSRGGPGQRRRPGDFFQVHIDRTIPESKR